MYGRFIDKLSSDSFDVLAFEVYHQGGTGFLYEKESGKRCPVYSVTKSITSSAFSIACGDGVVSPDTPLAQLLPKKYTAELPEGFDKLPMSRFLTMTAAEYPFRPSGENWLDTIFSLDVDYSVPSYHYSNIPAYLVGAAVENAVGKKLIEYLDERLFAPLGITQPPYSTSPEGCFYGATGMSFTVEELTRLGRLYLQNGDWNGTQLIGERFVKAAVTPHVDTGFGDHYGYFFRIAEDHFSMVGKWGQRCMIYPKYDLVISYLSNEPERSAQLYEAVKAFAAAEFNRLS